MGAHPRKLSLLTQDRWDQLKQLLSVPRVIAFGEVGLDYTEPKSQWARQADVLVQLLSLNGVSKPLILHLRGTSEDVLGAEVGMEAFRILKEWCARMQPIQLHCFTGGPYQVTT